MADGHSVTWFCAAVAGQPQIEVVDGVRIVRRGGRLGVFAAARRWYRSQPARAYDLVIDEVNTRPFLASRWVTDAPVVALIFQVCREIWWQEMPFPVAVLGRFYLERHWLAAYRTTKVLTISESSRASLAAYGMRDISVVPVGIAPAARPDVAKEAVPTMLFVGRLASNKRPGEAVAAFEIVRRALPEAQLWIVGSGPERDALVGSAPAGSRSSAAWTSPPSTI